MLIFRMRKKNNNMHCKRAQKTQISAEWFKLYYFLFLIYSQWHKVVRFFCVGVCVFFFGLIEKKQTSEKNMIWFEGE